MDALVGSTGFLGGQLLQEHRFDLAVHRPDLERLRGACVDVLVCAGLPAEKWRANKEPQADWENMTRLAAVLASVQAARPVLISTIDVYQPAVGVDESDPASFDGQGAYGTHRAWFEAFFQAHFPDAVVVRLPGLYGPGLRKNLVRDLLEGLEEQYLKVNATSRFQFFDTTRTWDVLERTWELGLPLLNVTSEPVTAQDVAGLFGVTLQDAGPRVEYDMRSRHSEQFGGRDGYLYSKADVLAGIDALRAR